MTNPWLEILHTDYENHMSAVGQAQVLNKLMQRSLRAYQPERFALLGCSTGNGLEYVNTDITKAVFAIDINPDYLNIVHKKFKGKIGNLKTINMDIAKDELKIEKINLFFVGLVLEYVEPIAALEKIITTLSPKGVLTIVIQKNKETAFVTKTQYKSLEKLSAISNEVNEREIDDFIKSKHLELLNRKELELTADKSFILIEYRKK